MRWTQKARCFLPWPLYRPDRLRHQACSRGDPAPAHVPHPVRRHCPVHADLQSWRCDDFFAGESFRLAFSILAGAAFCCSECSIIVYHRAANSPRQHSL